MAKAILNPSLYEPRGKVGTLYPRQLQGETIFQRVPNFSKRKLTADQKAHLGKLGSSARQASVLLKDPKLRAARGQAGAETAGRHRHPRVLPQMPRPRIARIGDVVAPSWNWPHSSTAPVKEESTISNRRSKFR